MKGILPWLHQLSSNCLVKERGDTMADGDNLPRNFSWIVPGKLAGCGQPRTAPEIKSLGIF